MVPRPSTWDQTENSEWTVSLNPPTNANNSGAVLELKIWADTVVYDCFQFLKICYKFQWFLLFSAAAAAATVAIWFAVKSRENKSSLRDEEKFDSCCINSMKCVPLEMWVNIFLSVCPGLWTLYMHAGKKARVNFDFRDFLNE